MKRVLLMGPPGVGKGTQATMLSQHLSVVTISTGDMFRHHVREATPLGSTISALIAAGEFIPDEVTNLMVADRLRQPDVAAGFILDGYPRTPDQVDHLDMLLAETANRLDVALLLTADDEEIVERLTLRAQSEGRADDTPDVIRHRIDLYKRGTAPLAKIFRERDLLVEVDGTGAPSEVAGRIQRHFARQRFSTMSPNSRPSTDG